MSLENDITEIRKLVNEDLFKPASKREVNQRFNDQRAHFDKPLLPGDKEKILASLDRLIARTRSRSANPYCTRLDVQGKGTKIDPEMVRMYLDDAADYEIIRQAVLQDRWGVVDRLISDMDTVARDELPGCLVNKMTWGG